MARSASRNFASLRQKDLIKCPVWEFVAEPRGRETEEWVRPRTDIRRLTAEVLAKSFILLVAADFRFADGAARPGYLTPCLRQKLPPDRPAQGEHPLGTLQPHVFGRSGHVGFWYGVAGPDKTRLNRIYAQLGHRASEVFPVVCRSTVPFSAGVVADVVIPAFFYTRTEFVISR